jgi:hypothetical protein
MECKMFKWFWGQEEEKKTLDTEAALADINRQIENVNNLSTMLDMKSEEWTRKALKSKREKKIRDAAIAIKMRKLVVRKREKIDGFKLMMEQRKLQLEGEQSEGLVDVELFKDVIEAVKTVCEASYNGSTEDFDKMKAAFEAWFPCYFIEQNGDGARAAQAHPPCSSYQSGGSSRRTGRARKNYRC